MSEFQELIKNIDKCRDYVRDFFVYGFKSRSDFPGKSARTYDDERRRIVSWLPEYVREDFTENERSKNISLQIDQKKLDTNPLFSVWQTKSFTDRDLMLHFFLLKLLEDKDAAYSAAELTELIMDEYGCEADLQSVRRKCNEYAEEGLLTVRREGKSVLYSRGIRFDELPCTEELTDMIRCFQLDQPLGIVGHSILSERDEANGIFRIKHGFPSFTLEDEILLCLLEAMRENRTVEVLIQSSRNRREVLKSGCPLKIFVSTRSGRRYVCMYSGKRNSFPCFRLDQIKEVKCTDPVPEKERKTLLARLEERSVYVWGVSGITENSGMQKLVLTIHADEDSEAYIVQRLIREGEGGTVERTAADTFRYEKTVTDVMEMFPWIRSFIGRIEGLKIYGTDGSGKMKEDAELEARFYRDLQKMYRMYEI